MTTRKISIYAENRVGVPPLYAVTEEAVRRAWRDDSSELSVIVRPADAPDMDALGKADCFVGSGFDPAFVGMHAKRLRLVHCNAAGVEKLFPLDWLPPSAQLTNSSGVHAEKGGAFGAMAILMLNENMPRHFTSQRRHVWQVPHSTVITGKTVLIVGLGALGKAVAARIKPFGVRVIGIRHSGQAHPHADAVHTPDGLHEALQQADFLALTCPLTPQTHGLIGRAELSLLPQGASVLNLARGSVMDNDALVEALALGRLSGAFLDVFDTEPLPEDSSLWDVPNLVISPHVSCDDAARYLDSCLAILADNIRRLIEGRPLRNVVSRHRGY